MDHMNAEQIGKIVTQHRPPKLDAGPDYDHVFDPFEFEGRTYFHHYMSNCYCWMLRPTLARSDKHPHPAQELEDPEYAQLVSFMPPPPMPDRPFPEPVEGIPSGIFQGPIHYRGKQFVWFVAESSGGWKLAITTTPDKVEQGETSAP